MKTLKLLRNNVNYLGGGVWEEDAIDESTSEIYKIKYIRRIYQGEPWMKLDVLETSKEVS